MSVNDTKTVPFRWVWVVLALACALYGALLGYAAFTLGRMPESFEERLLVSSSLFGLASAFFPLAFGFPRHRDTFLGLGTILAVIGLSVQLTQHL